MPTIDKSQLAPGDLIFTYSDPQGTGSPPGINRGMPRARHVSMVTDTSGPQPRIVHGVNMRPNASAEQIGLHFGGVRRDRHNQPVERLTWRGGTITGDLPIDQKQDVKGRVVRCVRSTLARKAVDYATAWAELEVPYGRNGQAEAMERAADDGDALVSELRSRFLVDGKFRAIKYAARRESFLHYPGADGDGGAGMFCSMFLVVCYQVAGLDMVVGSVPASDLTTRVADRRLTTTEREALSESHGEGRGHQVERDLRAFAAYTDRSLGNAPPPPRRGGHDYRPSISFWRPRNVSSISDFDWTAHITRGMMIDALFTYPTGLFEALMDDPLYWNDLGDVVGAREFSESKDAKNKRMLEHGRQIEFQKRAFARGSTPFPGRPKDR